MCKCACVRVHVCACAQVCMRVWGGGAEVDIGVFLHQLPLSLLGRELSLSLEPTNSCQLN